MDLSPYLESLRRDLATAAAPAGEDVARTAEMLATALDSSARLCLIEALADATAEITTKLDGTTVEVRMHGRSVDLVVNSPNTEPPPVVPDGGDMTRLTLRLPEQLKEAVERAAAIEGVSVNSWLARAAQLALHPATPPSRSSQSRRYTGFAQA